MPQSGSNEPSRESTELRALGVLALIALAALIRVALPVGVGLFLGALLAFTLQPIYGRLRSRHWSAGRAALACSLGALVIVTGIVTSLGVLFITRGIALAVTLPSLLGPGGAWRESAVRHLSGIAALHFDANEISAKLQEGAIALGSRAAGFTALAAGATFGGMLMLLFMALATYFVLVHWHEIVQHAERMLPFNPRHTHALLDEFRRAGRQVLRGTVVTGLVQGLFASIVYLVTRVPDPAFFGALTAVASLVPGIGTLLVWAPIGIYLVVTGHVGLGILELVLAMIVVIIIPDYVIRPKLVGSEKGVPAVLTFVSLFGGVEAFGLIGLVLGPVIVTLAVAVLRTYDAELARRRGL